VAANEAKIVITADDKASGKLDGISNKAKSMRKAFLAVSGAVTGVGIASIKFASDLDEAINKATVTFGNASGVVKEFGEASAASFGISERAANEYAGTLGTILNASGLAEGASAEMSVELVKLAADMASFNNIPIDVALEKLRSGLVGEVEPLRTVGVLLSAAEVNAQAYAQGIAEQGAQLTEAQKVQARYSLILSQTTAQQGDFTRTADSLANSTRIMKAQLEDAAAELGEQLLPAAQKIVQIANSLIERFSNLSSGTKTVILVVGGLAGALAMIGLALPPIITGIGLAQTAIGALRFAMMAFYTSNPLLFAFTAITLAIGVVIANWHHFEGVIIKGVNYLIEAGEMYANTWVFVINKIIDGINTLGSVFGVQVNKISEIEIPRLKESVDKAADAIEENNDGVIKSNQMVADSFTSLADSVKDDTEQISAIIKAQNDAQLEDAMTFAEELLASSDARYEQLKKQRWQNVEDEKAALEAEAIAREEHNQRMLEGVQAFWQVKQAKSKEEFDELVASMRALPEVIQTGSVIGADAMRAFKNSQNSLEQQLQRERERLAGGAFGGGTTAAMVEAEIRRLESMLNSDQGRGVKLGEMILAARGQTLGGAPPMLPGMNQNPTQFLRGENGMQREGVFGNTYVVNGDVYGFEDFADKVEQAQTQNRDAGAIR
jgi:hypothetical protein